MPLELQAPEAARSPREVFFFLAFPAAAHERPARLSPGGAGNESQTGPRPPGTGAQGRGRVPGKAASSGAALSALELSQRRGSTAGLARRSRRGPERHTTPPRDARHRGPCTPGCSGRRADSPVRRATRFLPPPDRSPPQLARSRRRRVNETAVSPVKVISTTTETGGRSRGHRLGDRASALSPVHSPVLET